MDLPKDLICLICEYSFNNLDTESRVYFLENDYVSKNLVSIYYWMDVSGYPKLSESFIKKFQNKIFWWIVLRYNRNLNNDIINFLNDRMSEE